MRAQQIQTDTLPRRILFNDNKRGLIAIRNRSTTSTDIVYLQFRSPSDESDAFPIDAGETLTLDRGDLSHELWLWGSAANIDVRMLVG